MSEDFWKFVVQSCVGVITCLGFVMLLCGWPKFFTCCKCKCDSCENFKKQKGD